MNDESIRQCLTFIQDAERLKNVLRSGRTSEGRAESTAEHTWRLCLLAMVFESAFGKIDIARLLKICVVHDLGEAIRGDIPAPAQANMPHKSAQEREDLRTLLAPLPPPIAAELFSLWEEYESASTIEARLAKGLDKIETIVQHNQGKNPDSFDYAFNLSYGQQHMSAHPLFEAIRLIIDADTAQRAANANGHPVR